MARSSTLLEAVVSRFDNDEDDATTRLRGEPINVGASGGLIDAGIGHEDSYSSTPLSSQELNPALCSFCPSCASGWSVPAWRR